MPQERDPLYDPLPGDVFKVGPGWTRTVKRVEEGVVYFDVFMDNEEHFGLKMSLYHWRISPMEVLHVAE